MGGFGEESGFIRSRMVYLSHIVMYNWNFSFMMKKQNKTNYSKNFDQGRRRKLKISSKEIRFK